MPEQAYSAPEGFVFEEEHEPPAGFVFEEQTTQVSRTYKSPDKLYSRIKEGTEDQDRARQLSTLFFAEKTGQDPNSLDLNASVKSYFGETFEGQNPSQVLKHIKNTLEPDEDENFKELQRISSLSPEEFAKENNIQDYILNPKEWHDREKQKLFMSSPKALFKASDKVLDKEAKRMARKALIDKDMSVLDWAKLTKEQQEVFPLYMYHLNPEQAESAFPEMVERVKQASGRAGEAIASSLENLDLEAIRTPKKLYYAFASKLGRDLKYNGQPLIDKETGRFTSPEAEKEANKILDEIYESEGNSVFNHIGAGLSPVSRPSNLKARYEEYKKNLALNINQGLGEHEQKSLDRKISNLVNKRFEKGGLGRQSLMSGVDMGVDLVGAIGSGVIAGPIGASSYSFNRFFGEFTETLIHDHRVDPTEAKGIAAITSVPYVALEYMQVKGLTEVQKSFALSWQKGIGAHLKNNAKEFGKNWASETAQETAQSIVEASGKAFAKEFAEGQGITYEQLMKDVGNEFIEAAKGMAVISMAGTGVKSARSYKEYKAGYAQFDKADNMAKQEGPKIEESFLSQKQADAITPELVQEFRNSTLEEKEAIAEELELSVEQLEDEVLVDDFILEELKAETAKMTDLKEKALAEIPQKAERFNEMLGDNADLVKEGEQYVLKGRDNDISFPVNFTEENSLGNWDGKQINIGLRGDVPVFNHEVTHAMRDLGLIEDSDWSVLNEMAQEYHKPEGIEAIKGFYKDKAKQDLQGEDLAHELIATMIEDIRAGKAEMPSDNRGILQKIIDFFKNLVGKTTEGKYNPEKNRILKDVYEGKPLAKQTQKPVNPLMQKKQDGSDVYLAQLEKEEKQYEEYLKQEVSRQAAQRAYSEKVSKMDQEEYEAELEKDLKRQEREFNKVVNKEARNVRDYIINDVAGKKIRIDDKVMQEIKSQDVLRKVSKYISDKAEKSFDEVMDDLGFDPNQITEFVEALAGDSARYAVDRNDFKSVDDISKKWDPKVDDLFLFENDKEIKLNNIVIPKDSRKRGIGTEILNDISSYADKTNKVTRLTPALKDDRKGTTSKARLKNFYKRFGFVENKGRNKDFYYNADEMYREPANKRYALDRTDQAASEVLAKEFYEKNITNEQAVRIAKKLNVSNPEDIVFKAQNIALEVQRQKLEVKTDEEINRAIKEAEIKVRFQQKVDEMFKQGHRQGEVYERAKKRLKEQQEAFKTASVSSFRIPEIEVYADHLQNAVITDSDLVDIIENVEREVRAELKRQGKDSTGNSPEVRGAMAKTFAELANSLVRELTPSRRKESIYRDIRDLKNYRMQSAIKANFKKILDKIKSTAIKQTQKELRGELKKALKKFAKLPKKGVESRKSNIHASKHMFLHYGNQYKSLNNDRFNEELEAIKSQIDKYRDSDSEAHRIIFEELELKHQALVAFGGLDTQGASSSDINDALELANNVIADGKELVNRLEVAHQAKYAAITEDITNAVESGKKFVTKVDHKPLLNQLTQMNVRGQLESITAYGTESQKKSLEKILLDNDAAKIKKFQMVEAYNAKLLNEVNDIFGKPGEEFNRNKLQTLMNKLSLESDKYRKYSFEQRTDISKADLMQTHMAFRQQHVVDLATRLNADGELVNPDLNRRYQLLDEMRKELSAKEIQLAEKMGDILNELLPEVNKTFYKQYGVNLRVQEENYFPLKIQTKQGGFKQQMSTVSVAPSFTIARTSHSNDLNERANIFEVFSAHVADAAHYTKTYDSQAGIRTALTNRRFRESVRTTYGDSTLNYIDESVVDMAVDRPLVAEGSVREIDFVRSIMSTISIGFNPKSVFVAGIGAVNAFATHKGLISSIKSSMANPQEVIDDMKFISKSIVIQKRKEQGLNEGMQNARQKAKGNDFLRMYQDAAFWGLTGIDELASVALGGVVYNQFKNSEQSAGLSKEDVEAYGLALVNRAIQEAYQPTESDFLPADIRRGGSYAKSFFQFATEPKSKLGIYFRDIKQVKAEYQKGNKKEAIKKAINIAIGQHLVIPGAYWLAGEIMRGLTDDGYDIEEAIRRLGTGILMGPASGLLVWGTGIEILAQTITGDRIFYGGSSIPSDRIMQEVGFLLRNVNDDDTDLLDKIDKIIQRYVLMYKYTKKALNN